MLAATITRTTSALVRGAGLHIAPTRPSRTSGLVAVLSILVVAAGGSDLAAAEAPRVSEGGVAAPSSQAAIIEGPIDPTDLASVGGVLYFVAEEDGDPVRKLWRSDGTNAGTYPIDTCRTILVCGAPRPPRTESREVLHELGDLVIFVTKDGLWRSDGTVTGTYLLAKDADVHGGRGGQVPSGAERDRLGDDVCDVLVQGTRAYLIASSDCYDPAYRQLWVTDGSRRGTRMLIRRFDAHPKFLTESSSWVGQRLFLPNQTGSDAGSWVTDGTRQGTRVLKVAADGGAWSLSYSAPVTVGDRDFVVADDGVHGMELWVTDGTTRGTRMVRDIRRGRRGSDPWLGERWPRVLAPVLGDGLLFVADDGIHGRELWLTDGTRTGTRLIMDIRPGRDGGLAREDGREGLTRVGDRVFMIADDGAYGPQLWTTQGIEESTRRLTELPADQGSPFSIAGWEHGDVALLMMVDRSAADPSSDYLRVDRASLWRTDGTPEGTDVLRELGSVPDDGSCDVDGRATWGPSGRLLFFVAPEADGGCRLWRTDGTTAGTFTLGGGNVWDVPVSSSGRAGSTYFLDSGPGAARRLWRTDGTRAGTSLVSRDGPVEFEVTGRGLFFVAGDGSRDATTCWSSGCRLWFLPDEPLAPPTTDTPAEARPSPSHPPATGSTDLVDAFPETVGGQNVKVRSMDGRGWLASLDPADPDDAAAIAAVEGFTADLDRGIDDLAFAYALARVKGRPAAIMAIQVSGVRPSDLVDAVIPLLFSDTVEPAREGRTLAGKRVIRISDAAIPGSYPRYIRSRGDVVWVIEADEPSLTEIIAALP